MLSLNTIILGGTAAAVVTDGLRHAQLWQVMPLPRAAPLSSLWEIGVFTGEAAERGMCHLHSRSSSRLGGVQRDTSEGRFLLMSYAMVGDSWRGNVRPTPVAHRKGVCLLRVSPGDKYVRPRKDKGLWIASNQLSDVRGLEMLPQAFSR